jgi:S-adenosylmethionine hydrolase
MALITLTTDWQSRDYYSGMMTGRLSRMIPDARVILLNHSIEPFHGIQGAYLLRQAIPEFPDGTIHLFLVNQGHRPDIWPSAARFRRQFLIGWDDGLLPLVMDEDPEEYIRVDNKVLETMDRMTGAEEPARNVLPSFPELSVFSRIAMFISRGFSLKEAMGEPIPYNRVYSWQPVLGRDQIDGQVVFIDGYGNAITNINRSQVEKTGQGRIFEVVVKSNHYRLKEIHNSYMGVDPGELITIFNSAFLLEIAIVQGNAAELIGLEPGTAVKIRFYNDEQGRSNPVFQPVA